MWAYDGWANLPIVAEEVRNPARNVPRALIVGIILLIVLYTGANLAYHLTLPSSEIATAKITAATAAEKLLPNFGGKLTMAMLAVSIFGALNANILTGPRVLFRGRPRSSLSRPPAPRRPPFWHACHCDRGVIRLGCAVDSAG